MAWAFAILFGIAALLLIFSLLKIKQTSIKEQREMDALHVSLMNEIKQLQQQVRNMELDIEIIVQKTGIESLTLEERTLIRDILDLYRRGYSYASIAAQKNLSEKEVEQLIAPYQSSSKAERSNEENAG
jgi:DNA-binding NarL/FixJ family response regulator